MKKIIFFQEFYSTDHKEPTLFFLEFSAYNRKENEGQKALLPRPSMSIRFVVKPVHDVIEGMKCMAMHTLCEQKTIFMIICAMLCIFKCQWCFPR